MEMRDDARVREAELLRDIAETINGTYDMTQMLDAVLDKVLELTGLTTGWVFLVEPRKTGELRCAADVGLPPALARDGKQPMRGGTCWCVDRFRDGRLRRAANILNCKRIEDAILHKRGDTGGLTHHASIPLRSGDDLFGILNVGASGKTAFSDEELSLLQSVALQIGTASHRIRLYGEERKRAAMFERLGAVASELRAVVEPKPERIAASIVRVSGETFGWSNVSLWMRESQGLFLHASYDSGEVRVPSCGSPGHSCALLDEVLETLETKRLAAPVDPGLLPSGAPIRAGAAVPLLLQGRPIGVLVAGSSTETAFDGVDAEVLSALSAHAALTYENARLQEQGKTLARWEERNRIARDLHDSVSQMLFSLQLHAKGLEAALAESPAGVRRAATEIGRLSREALAEMRGMIRQLRPAGLEEGLLTGLTRYGASIGVTVACDAGALRQLPERVELALWRIGQEALNNVVKHAGVDRASIALAFESGAVVMTVSDRGNGFRNDDADGYGFGMTTMRERAESAGGAASVDSRPGYGTDVRVRLPLPAAERGGE
ncbi:GAF domain-containing sensor histidine kinase [Paenibacillus sp.]|uniref:GAF domain-containing sensor histidine kinase n=1 Tax=Paenibacillus sp. TaxID=58172 RepID=UPI0028111009|nr:GAF domain-containing sensor histidine kinase [Paenibacillus sp.]